MEKLFIKNNQNAPPINAAPVEDVSKYAQLYVHSPSTHMQLLQTVAQSLFNQSNLYLEKFIGNVEKKINETEKKDMIAKYIFDLIKKIFI